MICKFCGVQIADKALICYTCGHATAEPRVAPPAARRKRSRLPLVAALMVLLLVVLGAWYVGFVAP